ncbi:hypothetical protein AMAG_11427 [Allomyces macrogynus ATCC 38327]|uniref:G-patch domain-containing protein n=1 Tax=Allomyces macrogynus (strain ATCC 38327) TaxID=578462 RepID=A0A0L0SWP1_ALLM3|nr:hypothetical protein AMAG_11427 [Allomyces macrogynus ATCC 38327]|eukprot:KNE66953.1 hypothetical protein AMAG_11427 [Allomyces macrogynus ATCC 38327]
MDDYTPRRGLGLGAFDRPFEPERVDPREDAADQDAQSDHGAMSSSDGASDEDGGDRIPRRRRRRNGDDDDDDSEDDDDARRRRQQEARKRAQAERLRAAARASSWTPTGGPAVATPDQPVAVGKNFGKFAGTGGLGLKMLMKMGYMPGTALGSKGEGIVEPIQVVKRPQGMGIAFNDFDERPDATPTPPPPPPPAPEPVKGKKPAAEKRAPPRVPSNAFKKSAKVKRTYLTAQDVLDHADDLGTPRSVDTATPVIDMRASGVPDSMLDPTTTKLAELVQNMTLFVDLSSHDLRQRALQRDRDRELLVSAQERQRGLRTAQLAQQNRITQLADLIARAAQAAKVPPIATAVVPTTDSVRREIEDVQIDPAAPMDVDRTVRALPRTRMVDENDASRLPDVVLEMLDTLVAARESFPNLPFDALACSLVTPHARVLLADWDPLAAPYFGRAAFQRIKSAVHVPRTAATKRNSRPNDDQQVLAPNGDSSSNNSGKSTYFDALLWHLWLPRVRATVTGQWSVHDPTPLLALLDAWYPSVLTPGIYHYVVQHLVLPRLRMAVDGWSPRTARKRPRRANAGTPMPAALHEWLFPWLESMHFRDEPVGMLFPTLVYKLTVYLQDVWDPAVDGMCEGIRHVAPWRALWDKDAYAQFVGKAVVPKLTRFLAKGLVINPAHQDLSVLDAAVIEWHPHVPAPLLAKVLVDGGFFAQWLDVLHQWLSARDTDLAEIGEWYATWRAYLPEDVANDAVAQPYFAAALELMQRAVAGEQLPPVAVLVPQVSLPIKVSGPSTRMQVPLATASAHVPGAGSGETVTYRDVVEAELAAHGLMLVATHEAERDSGRPVYEVRGGGPGSVRVYLDQGVLFAQAAMAGSGAWDPCDVAAVVRRAGGGDGARKG